MRNYYSRYYVEQRRIHGGRRNLACPDCGKPNCMTQGELNKGYHCSSCTREIEGYQEPHFNEEMGMMDTNHKPHAGF